MTPERESQKWRIVRWHEGDPIVFELEDGTRFEEPNDSSDQPGYFEWYEDLMLTVSAEMDEHVKAGRATYDDEFDTYRWEPPCPLKFRPASELPEWMSTVVRRGDDC